MTLQLLTERRHGNHWNTGCNVDTGVDPYAAFGASAIRYGCAADISTRVLHSRAALRTCLLLAA
jgi:hypothetical protein